MRIARIPTAVASSATIFELACGASTLRLSLSPGGVARKLTLQVGPTVYGSVSLGRDQWEHLTVDVTSTTTVAAVRGLTMSASVDCTSATQARLGILVDNLASDPEPYDLYFDTIRLRR